MRICLVYDCLYPWTVGGAERWMRDLGEALARDGHEVTYLTRLQWDRSEPPSIPGIRVLAVSRREPLYGPAGNRRIGPPLRFGWGVLGHLLRHRGEYDVVHTGAFPYFSLLAAAVALAGRGGVLAVDWFEVWTRRYWIEYVGRAAGTVGWLVQRLCARVPQRAFVFSRLHARRLREEGLRGELTVLAGLFPGAPPAAGDGAPAVSEPLVVFAGRHIAEKRVTAIPPAIQVARHRVPGLRALILGDGPTRPATLEAIARADVGDVVAAPGFVNRDAVEVALGDAMCLLLPSSREGYGLVVIEAAARGTPSIVVAGEDNAAVELIEDGVNGVVATSAGADDLAAAIERVHAAGPALRARTRAWFAANADRVSLAASLSVVLEAYRPASARS